MKSSNPTVYVSRAVVKAGLDLSEVTRIVSRAVWEQYATFDAQSEWDICPVEIHMDFVIVHDDNKLKYFMAKFDIDKEKNVKFKDVQEVKRQWATVKTVERSEEESMIPTYWAPPTKWGNILVH